MSGADAMMLYRDRAEACNHTTRLSIDDASGDPEGVAQLPAGRGSAGPIRVNRTIDAWVDHSSVAKEHPGAKPGCSEYRDSLRPNEGYRYHIFLLVIPWSRRRQARVQCV
jgi:hypothetical protein